MHLLLAVLLLAVAVAPVSAQHQPGATRGPSVKPASVSATVWGQVRSEKSNAPLRFALVELISPVGQPSSAITDSSGFYVLRDVRPGRRMLRVTHIDHAPHEIEVLVVAQQQHVIDFDLEFRPVRLSAVAVEGARIALALDTVPARESDLGPATVRVLESTPGVAELGLSEAARDVPGHEPVDPADVLYVRGGSADLKLVLLNGAPVYAPFHVGGLIHALDADVLRSASLQMGGAPARYDGGLSYIMDLETRAGRSVVPHGMIAVDMLSARTIVEGPVGDDVAFLASARTVHGLGTGPLMSGGFPYGYGDALARFDYTPHPLHAVTLTGFWNHERVQLDTAGAMRESASWGNRAGSLRYRGVYGETDVVGTLAVGQFRTLLPLRGILPLVTEGTALRTRASLDMERPVGSSHLYWGGSAEVIEFEYRAFPQGVSREKYVVKSRANGGTWGVYGDASISLLPRVRVRGGLRADLFAAEEESEVRFAPRISTTVLLTDRATLTLSAGRFQQFVRAPGRSLVFLGNVVPDSGAGSVLNVADASHLVLALSQDLGEGIRLGLDGFYKQFDGLNGEDDVDTNSSGVDLWVRRNSGAITGWLGYSLAWIWTVEDGARAQEFSGRHLVTAGVIGPIIGRSVFDIRISYGAGLPYTAIPEPEISSSPAFDVMHVRDGPPLLAADDTPVPTEPQNAHIRLDAQVSRTFAATVRHLDFEFTPYVKVINALNRRDAIFYHYDRDVGRAEPVADLPVVPIIGMEWKF